MKITKNYLKQVIKEELEKILEVDVAKNIADRKAMQQQAENPSVTDYQTSPYDSKLHPVKRGVIPFFGVKFLTTLSKDGTKMIVGNYSSYDNIMQQVGQKISSGDSAAEEKLIELLKFVRPYSEDEYGLKPAVAFIRNNQPDAENETIAGSSKLFKMYASGAFGNKARELIKTQVNAKTGSSTNPKHQRISSRTTKGGDAIPMSGPASTAARMAQIRESHKK